MRVSLFALIAATSLAHADPDPAAAKLFEEGRIAAKAGNYSEACAKFTRSLELDPAVGTELNLADCIEHQGFPSRAWKLFDDAANKSEHDARAKFARDRANGLLPKITTIVLEVAEPSAPGLVLTIGDKPVALTSEIREHVDPGQLDITATVPGQPRFVRTVLAVAGGSLTIDIPAFGVAKAVAPLTQTITRRKRSRVYLAFGTGGLGIAGLAIAGIVGLSARSQYQDQLDSGACHGTGTLTCTPAGAAAVASAGDTADLATLIFIGSAVLVAGGVALYFTAPHEQVVSVTPMASTTGIGLQLGTRF